MTTLADMTPQERAECVGMWCDVTNASVNEDKPVVLCSDKEVNGVLPVYIPWVTASFYPTEEGVSGWPADGLAPRFDLPRAWNPDGQPPAGKWENDYTDSDGSTLTTGEDLDVGPHQEVRRFVTEWEEITNG